MCQASKGNKEPRALKIFRYVSSKQLCDFKRVDGKTWSDHWRKEIMNVKESKLDAYFAKVRRIVLIAHILL